MSETAKHRQIVRRYCYGNGVDLGAGGDPVVPWAIQVELPGGPYNRSLSFTEDQRAQWVGSATDLPFKDGVLDFVHASHLLEDFLDWQAILREWDRVLAPGGFLIIAVPDHDRFRAAVARGQGDNLAHKRESRLGEVGEELALLGSRYQALFDAFVSDDPFEYSLLTVARKGC